MKKLKYKYDRVSRLFGILLIIQTAILVFSFSISALLPSPDVLMARLDELSMRAYGGEAYLQTTSSPLERLMVEVSGEEGLTDAAKVVDYKVRSGDTLSAIWTKNGAPFSGALGAAQALRDVKLNSNLRAGDVIKLTLSVDGDIVGFFRDIGDGRSVTLTGNSLDGYEAELLEPEIDETQREVSGTIFSSLAASAGDSGIPASVVDDFVDLFSSRVEFRRDLQPGDTFSISYMQRTCKRRGAELTPGNILSASLQTADGLLVAVSYRGKDDKLRYYDEAGKPLGNYFLRYPLKFSRISSTFSTARFHPVLNRSRPHNGVDFAAPTGTPVRSVADGVVVEAGYHGGAGNMVRIQHSDKYTTEYFHLSKIAAGVRKGTRVSRGELIGLVGTTGLSTGPHLHFGFFVNNRYVDPMSVKLPNLSDGVESIPSPILLAQLENIRRQHETMTVASRGDLNPAG